MMETTAMGTEAEMKMGLNSNVFEVPVNGDDSMMMT